MRYAKLMKDKGPQKEDTMEGQATGRTVVTEDVEIVGTIKAGNGLQIDGKLNGDLNCTKDVAIGKSGNVKGNIMVGSVSVQGQVNGNIIAKDRIELKAAARVTGDVKAKRLTVEDGVSFIGKAEVNPSGIAAGKAGGSDEATDAAQGSGKQANDGGQRDKDKASSLFGKK